MPTSRREILSDLEKSGPIIVVNWKEKKKALSELERTRREYEEARMRHLRMDLPIFYRVAVFGSARLSEESKEFEFVTELTKAMVEARGVDIVTGGGPGIMEAANLGVRLAIEEASVNGRKIKSKSVGETITLPFEQTPNQHLDRIRMHPEFSTRLQAFLDTTQAAYNAPGGIGTLLEMVLLTQTQQVGHLENDYPILADPYWEPVVESWHRAMYHGRDRDKGEKPLINEDDMKRIKFSNNIPTIVDIFSKDYDRWYKNIRSKVRIVD